MQRAALLAGCVIAFGLLRETAFADDSIGALREDLERLEQSPGPIPPGARLSLGYQIDVADRIGQRFRSQSAMWRRKARRYLDQALAGTDPFPLAKGEIVNRGYPTPVSLERQGYAVYIPPDYDPARAYPLLVVLHGGSSNGNLFLGVVLGNNMSWERYREFLWDEFVPRTFPELIVVAPDGFGQVMWRWMGERDVLDVIDDVQRHYHVDADRITLMGLSNGGVGAYAIGTRFAWRFNVVQAVAGAPSWLFYAGGSPSESAQIAMRRFSATHLPDNTRNTDFRFYHGHTDTGPMRPNFVTRFESVLRERDIEPNVTWYDAGHDILYRVHRHGRRFDELGSIRRNRQPQTVYIETGDYRANRQHWVTVTGIENYPRIARVRASASENSIEVETRGAFAFSLDLRDAPVAGPSVRVVVDETEVYAGELHQLGHVVHLHRSTTDNSSTWRLGFTSDTSLRKRPGLSGPLTDAYRERMVHVVGTQNPDHVDELRKTAERAARGWPLWLWHVRQEVVEDQAVTPELMQSAHLVLYGGAGDNSVLDELAPELPIQVTDDAVVVGDQRFEGNDVGVRYIYPNPQSPTRYVIVQAGVSPAAVERGNRLPDFLPDYVVYNDRTTSRRERLATTRGRALAEGYFDDRWQLPTNEVRH